MSETAEINYEVPLDSREKDAGFPRGAEDDVAAMTSGLEAPMEEVLRLGAEMSQALSVLTGGMARDKGRIRELERKIGQKQKELQLLYGLDASAASLERLQEVQRLQKIEIERLMVDQNRLWEEEKRKLELEERDFVDNLRAARRREEESQRRWAEERERVQSEEVKNRDAAEKDLADRERRLREREIKCARLLDEIERLISRIAMRLQSNTDGAADPLKSVNEMLLSLNTGSESAKEAAACRREAALLHFELKRELSESEDRCLAGPGE